MTQTHVVEKHYIMNRLQQSQYLQLSGGDVLDRILVKKFFVILKTLLKMHFLGIIYVWCGMNYTPKFKEKVDTKIHNLLTHKPSQMYVTFFVCFLGL